MQKLAEFMHKLKTKPMKVFVYSTKITTFAGRNQSITTIIMDDYPAETFKQ